MGPHFKASGQTTPEGLTGSKFIFILKLIVDYKLDFLHGINCVNYFLGLHERVVLHMAACPGPMYIMDTVIGLKRKPIQCRKNSNLMTACSSATSTWGLWQFVALVWAQCQFYRSKGGLTGPVWSQNKAS